jgi:hypothetical protein
MGKKMGRDCRPMFFASYMGVVDGVRFGVIDGLWAVFENLTLTFYACIFWSFDVGSCPFGWAFV